MWQRSVGNLFGRLAINIEHGIFHGIDICDHRKTRANTGFSRLIYNRMGVSLGARPSVRELGESFMANSTPPPEHATSADERWMWHALELARRAGAQGEVPVGAVLVRNERIVGEGWNRPIGDHDPTAHAEVVAIRDAAARLSNYRLVECTLYVTLEPCAMCVGAIVHGRIGRVVFGATDTKSGAVGSALDLADSGAFNHKVHYQGGVLSEPCGGLLKAFFRERRRTRNPAG